MAHESQLLGGLIALLAAAVWGSGDYLGGLATRSKSQYQVLLLVSGSGLLTLLLAMLLRGEGWPSASSMAWGAAAGISGAAGIAALYRGLADAQAALVAPISAVVGVILPVVVGIAKEGPPPALRWAGIAAGLLGIWLVSADAGRDDNAPRRGLALAIAAGLGIGGFFVLISQVEAGSVFGPLVLAKAFAVLFAGVLLLFRRQRLPSILGNRNALVAGVFDAGGNVFFLVASHLTRLEIAALIASMSPAVTVALAAALLRQKATVRQVAGVVVSLLAIGLLVV
jgi:drug/metabolite transporter (DMT)-like permease